MPLKVHTFVWSVGGGNPCSEDPHGGKGLGSIQLLLGRIAANHIRTKGAFFLPGAGMFVICPSLNSWLTKHQRLEALIPWFLHSLQFAWRDSNPQPSDP